MTTGYFPLISSCHSADRAGTVDIYIFKSNLLHFSVGINHTKQTLQYMGFLKFFIT